jgi:hypothetical protein
MGPVHTHRADDVHVGDRIMLKDLRVLEVTGVSPQDGGTIIRYNELASKSHGSLATITGQKLKLLCEGGCSIERALEDLI